MSHAARIVQVIFWSVVLFLITPSKLAAIAYFAVIVGLVVAIIISLGILRGIISATKRFVRRP